MLLTESNQILENLTFLFYIFDNIDRVYKKRNKRYIKCKLYEVYKLSLVLFIPDFECRRRLVKYETNKQECTQVIYLCYNSAYHRNYKSTQKNNENGAFARALKISIFFLSFFFSFFFFIHSLRRKMCNNHD